MSYDENNHEEYWETLGGPYKNMPTKNVQIWRTDTHGQVSTNEENKEYIGKWTTGNETEDGNGKQLEEFCKMRNCVCRKTFLIPK